MDGSTDVAFYSILMDGSTDVANVDHEVFLVQWKSSLQNGLLTVSWPQNADVKGLFECLQSVLQEIGVAALHKENCKVWLA